MTDPEPSPEDLAAAAEQAHSLALLTAALIAGGAYPAAGTYTRRGPDGDAEPAAVILISATLTGPALAEASPLIAECLRRCADELDTTTRAPDHVPEAWTDGA